MGLLTRNFLFDGVGREWPAALEYYLCRYGTARTHLHLVVSASPQTDARRYGSSSRESYIPWISQYVHVGTSERKEFNVQ
jgi:hypothetical protein